MATADSVETYNLGGVTLHVHNFITNGVCVGSDTDVYGSSLQAIVGSWFNPTDTPTTGSLNAVEVSLASAATGLIKFFSKEQSREGKLYTLSLT